MLNFKRDDIIIQPKIHQYTVIFLPGWSRSAKLDLNVLKTVPFLENTRIRIVQAPHRPVSRLINRSLPSWFMIDAEIRETLIPGLNEISKLIDDILQDEYELCKQVFLMGFSQGGVTALYTGLVTSKVPLLGVVALSCFIPPVRWREERKGVPVFVYHGEKDEIVSREVNFGLMQTGLRGFSLTYKTDKDLGHTYSWKEFLELKEWMKNVIKREKI